MSTQLSNASNASIPQATTSTTCHGLHAVIDFRHSAAVSSQTMSPR
jgi:hypothetical protein